MKKTLVLFHFFVSLIVFSQTNERTLIILDNDTNLPIEDAIIVVLKSKQVLMSNSEGKTKFEVKGGSNLKVSHSSYLPITVKWASLNQQENIVYLKSKLTSLDDIIVTKQHPQEIIKQLVDNSIKTLNVPARLKAYSREFFKLNGDYTYYNDGLINFQLYKGDKKKIKSVLLVEQNRSFGMIKDLDIADLLGYNLNVMMEKYYTFRVLRPLLEEASRKKYQFTVKVSSIDQNLNEIIATPEEGITELLDNYKIIYDSDQKIILEIIAEISPEILEAVKEETTKGSKNIVRSFYKINFKAEGQNYYLISSNEEINFKLNTGNDIKDIEVINNIITTNFNVQNYTYKESDVFKDKTLFNIKNSILTEYWNTSGLTPTTKELEIINDIKGTF